MFAKRKAAKQATETAALHAELANMLMTAQGRYYPTTPIMLKAGENSLYVITGAGLFETRRGPGHWTGRSSGISVPVGGGIRVRTGASRGHYVQGDENPTIIDTGTVTFTTTRVVFTGPRYTREWDFNKLIAVQHFVNQPWTAIQVSNRQKTSGFTYKGLRPDFVHARLEMALSISQGERTDVIQQLQAQLAEMDARPSAPAAPAPIPASFESPPPSTHDESNQAGAQTTPHAPQSAYPATPQPRTEATAPPGSGMQSPPPAWYPDPAQIAQLRWWDGTQWTSYTTVNPAQGT